MAVPSGMTSTTTDATVTFSVMTVSGTMAIPAALATITANTTTTSAASSATTIPTTVTTVAPSTITTMTSDTPVAVTSSALPLDCGIGVTADTIITKKKLATKKRTTNLNTPKNLCARDWVPAVGGTTEEFDHHWDALPEEEKKNYIEWSKQLRLAALGR
ncbi:hypothetical protein BYT27DRAFT_7190654, partial [Phlegmacium glaucopus]